jgi:hypothetical protein
VVDLPLTKEKFEAFLSEWQTHYHARPHKGLGGRTPQQVVDAWPEPILRVRDERALDLLLVEREVRTVGKKGVQWDKAFFVSAELAAYIGERVEVRADPDDLGQVLIYSVDGAFLCLAQDPVRKGLDRQAIAEAARKVQTEAKRQLGAARRLARTSKARKMVLDDVLAHRAGLVPASQALKPAEFVDVPGIAAARLAQEALDLESTAAQTRTEPKPQSEAGKAMADAVRAELAPKPSATEVFAAMDAPNPFSLKEWGRWIRNNYDRATPADRAEYDRMVAENYEFRLLVGLERLA